MDTLFGVESRAVSSPVSVASGFRRYVRELRAVTEHAVRSGGLPLSAVDAVTQHLDGRVSRELRSAVRVEDLRSLGAFFTGEPLASRMLGHAPAPSGWEIVLDPACGSGDLLVAAARRLPVLDGLVPTLRRWGEVLHGTDRVPEFVEVARQRLALLALRRGARPPHDGQLDLAALLPGLRVDDGLRGPQIEDADVLVLNPPYGQVSAPADCGFASGLTSRAALWVDALATRLKDKSCLIALLPDVLRSGSRYARWRLATAARLDVCSIQPIGQFDALTDVDVFILKAHRRTGRTPHSWPEPAGGSRLGATCTVMVGPVVDRRDPKTGPWVPYITTRDLPQFGFHRPLRKRRYGKRVFAPPFVVIRRTSRPTSEGPRLRPVVILGDEPVAVENHLLVLVPQPATRTSCERLAQQLQDRSVTEWLNSRIRMRHLTVVALRALPLPQDPGPSSSTGP